MRTRRCLEQIAKSGLSAVLEEYTFERFQASESWQAVMKQKAVEYVRRGGSQWFIALGQTGAGKTHICTAICRELLGQGAELQYITWVDFMHTMERLRFKEGQHGDFYDPIRDAQVLYVDDFLKRENREFAYSVAFDLIDHRAKAGLKTIISGEMGLTDIQDKALAGRIYQMCGEWRLYLAPDEEKNRRLHRE